MGQITATRNLVATKVVRHAGQWNPIVEIRGSYDRLISTMGFPILVRQYLDIELWLLFAFTDGDNLAPVGSKILSFSRSGNIYFLLCVNYIKLLTEIQLSFLFCCKYQPVTGCISDRKLAGRRSRMVQPNDVNRSRDLYNSQLNSLMSPRRGVIVGTHNPEKI